MAINELADYIEIERYGRTMLARKLAGDAYRIEFYNKNHSRASYYLVKSEMGYGQIMQEINQGAWDGPWIKECCNM